MSKISEMSDGGTILTTDDIPVTRSGGNVRVKVADMATQSKSAVDITGGDVNATLGEVTRHSAKVTTLDATGNIIPNGGSSLAGSIWKSGANIIHQMDAGGGWYINDPTHTYSYLSVNSSGDTSLWGSAYVSGKGIYLGAASTQDISASYPALTTRTGGVQGYAGGDQGYVNLAAGCLVGSSNNWEYTQSITSVGRIEVVGDGFNFFGAPPGTAGNAISFTKYALIDSGGIKLDTGYRVVFDADAAGDTHMRASANDTLDTTSGGILAQRTIGANSTFYGDVTANDARFFADRWTASSSASVYGRNQHASFTSEGIFRSDASRSASSVFSYFRAYSSGGGDLETDIRGDGNNSCDGSWTGGGADYAEFFEWADGNADNEDRRGFAVTLVDDKIVKAQEGDVILGVISGNPSVVGDGDTNRWKGKYLRDDFGTYLLEEHTVTQWQEIDEPAVMEETEEVQRTWQKPIMVANPEYGQPIPNPQYGQPIANPEFGKLVKNPEYDATVEGSQELILDPNVPMIIPNLKVPETIPNHFVPEQVQAIEEVIETVTVPEDVVNGVLIPEHEDEQLVVNALFETLPVLDQGGQPVFDTVVTVEAKAATYKTVWYESDKVPEDVVIPDDAEVISTEEDGSPLKRRILNPDYIEGADYVSREDRQEWDTVGLMGKLRVRKGQPVASNWIKMRDVSDEVEEWLVR